MVESECVLCHCPLIYSILLSNHWPKNEMQQDYESNLIGQQENLEANDDGIQ